MKSLLVLAAFVAGGIAGSYARAEEVAPAPLEGDVSIYHSDEHPDMEIVEVTYKGCVTKFTIKMADLQKALKEKLNHGSSTVLDSMIDNAFDRYDHGCQ